jgi:hypothetical protein
MQIENDWSWRTLTLLQVLPAGIQLAFIYCEYSQLRLPVCLLDLESGQCNGLTTQGVPYGDFSLLHSLSCYNIS